MAYRRNMYSNVRQDTPSTAIVNFLQGMDKNRADAKEAEAAQQEAQRKQQMNDFIMRQVSGGATGKSGQPKMIPSYKINSKGEAEMSLASPRAGAEGQDFTDEGFDLTSPIGKKAFLQQFTPADRTAIIQMTKPGSTWDINKMVTGMNAGERRKRLMAAASTYSQGAYDPAKPPQRQKYLMGLTGSAPTTLGGQRNSLQTAIDHLKALHDDAAKLHNTPWPIVNAPMQMASRWLGGNAAPQNYSQDAQAIASELSKLYAASNISQQEIEDWKKTISPSSSPDQQAGSYNTAVRLMGGRANALGSQYKDVMGEPTPVSTFLNPSNQKAIADLKLGDEIGTNNPDIWKQDQSPYNAAIGGMTPQAKAPSIPTFTDPADVEKAYKAGQIAHGDTVMLNGKPFMVQDDEDQTQ